jgi:hypothetical protein
LLPGELPATTAVVFFDTDEVTLPPRATTAASACSRDIVS